MPTATPYRRPTANAPAAPRLAYDRTEERREAKRFYKSAPWRKLRAAHLDRHPLCAQCERDGRTVEAAHVHHVIERTKAPARALDPSNLESLCQPCHNRRRRESPL